MMDSTPLSLLELLDQTKSALRTAMPSSYWILAEINEMKVNYSGHCYLELIDKEDDSEQIRAKARATIWAATFRMLRPYFETTVQTELVAGLKIMVKVTVEFHEIYGFSLNIKDIEPSYTLGELAKQKKQVIEKLKAEGVFDMNRELHLEALPRKIAIVSSKTAAGFGDFADQLLNNSYGYKFYVKLFPAVMQGDGAEQSIISALDRVFTYEHFFDLVVIIRGGGARSDLGCFDGYLLTSHICQFPLPVFTGIGHEQDETIADLVAHTRLKTPTAVAEYLINIFRQADDHINELTSVLLEAVTSQVNEETDKLNRYLLIFKPAVKERLSAHKSGIRFLGMGITSLAKQFLARDEAALNRQKYRLTVLSASFINNKKHVIDMLLKKNNYLDPFLILKRGYSVTYYKGKALKDPKPVKEDDTIETKLHGGMLISKALKRNK